MAVGSAGTVPKISDSVPADEYSGQDDGQRDVKRMGMWPSTDCVVFCNALRAHRPDGINFNFAGKVKKRHVDIE